MKVKGFEIIRNWDIGKILSVSPVVQGASCKTYTIHSSMGKYILRGFDSHQQAEQEAEVFRALRGTKIGAELIQTKNKESYVFDNEKFYNLQTFIYGKKPNLKDEAQVCAAAKTVSKLHETLEKSTFSFSTYNRFSTDSLLQQVSDLDLPEQAFPKGIVTGEQRRHFVANIEREFCQNQVIHADLGDWNMLWNGNEVQIIDFGECRAGDFYFDLAAIISSILAKCDNKEDFICLLTVFLDTYTQKGIIINYEKLSKAVYIWLLRGILASTVNIHELSRRKRLCSHFMNEMIKYKLYIE